MKTKKTVTPFNMQEIARALREMISEDSPNASEALLSGTDMYAGSSWTVCKGDCRTDLFFAGTGRIVMCFGLPQAECDGSSRNGDTNEEVVIIKIRTLAAKIR